MVNMEYISIMGINHPIDHAFAEAKKILQLWI